MARYFKKRRPPAENKNNMKVQRRQDEGREGAPLGQVFPNVRQLKISLHFMTPRGEGAGEENRVITPRDPVQLEVSCPGACGVGTYNLGAKLNAVLEAGERVSDSSGKCQAPRYGGVEPCGYELQCHIEVDYAPAAAPAPAPAQPAPVPSEPSGE